MPSRTRPSRTRPSRTRSSLARAIAVGVTALAAGGLLAACGSDDSTATGNPAVTTAPVAASTPTADAAQGSSTPGSTNAVASQGAPAPVTSPGAAATAPPEQPSPVPGFPGPTKVPVEARDRAFLDALKAAGITPAADGSMAISTANYICAARAAGSKPDEISTFVTASVGSEAVAAGVQLTEEQAQHNAQAYIQAATAHYCS